MSRGSDARLFLDELSRLTSQQRLLRVLVLALPVVALMLEVRAGATPPFLVTVPFGLFTLMSVLLPDSHAPLAVILILGGYWGMGIGEELSVSLLLVTATLLAFHVTCLLTSYGPASVVLDPSLLGLWLRRFCVALAVALLVWLTARALTELDLPANGWLLAVALLVLVGWTTLLARRLSLHEG